MPIPNEDHLRYQADCALDPVEQEIEDPVACVDCGDIYDREDSDIHIDSDGEYRCIWCDGVREVKE
jgi:hypothetical protein